MVIRVIMAGGVTMEGPLMATDTRIIQSTSAFVSASVRLGLPDGSVKPEQVENTFFVQLNNFKISQADR